MTEQPPIVLVAEDNRTTRTFLCYKLEKQGFKVIAAENGRQAVDRLTDSVGAVLLDLQMPEMDGMACLDHIHTHFPDLQPIMITASEDVTAAVEAMKYGAFDYLIKPLNPDELVAAVNLALKGRDQNIRLRRVEAELARARAHETDIASRIQQTLLLGKFDGNMDGIRIASLTIPSRKIDGDFYDFYRVNDQCLDIVVGDVMGKGIPAALLGAAAKNQFLRILYELARTPLQGGRFFPRPSEIVAYVQMAMIDRLDELENFITLCYTRFDLARRTLTYVDCGHVRTIHYHADLDDCSFIKGGNMPIGFPEVSDYAETEVPFGPNDMFFFYSDGLTDARNEDGHVFGEARLLETVGRHAPDGPERTISEVRSAVVDFIGRESFSDDFTCVGVTIDDVPIQRCP